MKPTAGQRAEITVVAGEADTATALGSGDVPVLATPRLLALAELTAVDGRRLTFRVEAIDTAGTVAGLGTVERVVVDRDRFLARLAHPG